MSKKKVAKTVRVVKTAEASEMEISCRKSRKSHRSTQKLSRLFFIEKDGPEAERLQVVVVKTVTGAAQEFQSSKKEDGEGVQLVVKKVTM